VIRISLRYLPKHDAKTRTVKFIMNHQQKHLLISGRVQRVGFRQFTKTSADRLGVVGWVRNLPDGRVEAVIEGDAPSLDAMMAQLREGPPAARVEEVESRDLARGETEQLDGSFEIRR